MDVSTTFVSARKLTGTEIISTSSPFCTTVFNDGLRANGGTQEVREIAQFINVVV